MSYEGYSFQESGLYQDLSVWGTGGWGTAPAGGFEAKRAAEPLLERLEAYDALRRKLETEGGILKDIRRMTELLREPVLLSSPYGPRKVSLAGQGQLRTCLRQIDWSLEMEVRQTASGMPLYYICRTRHDYWGEYGFVVEDLYTSPGYPLADPRFVRLMTGGHEHYFIRLSPFRQAFAASLCGKPEPDRVDRRLYSVGRHVFQASWHEDQCLAALVSKEMGLEEFPAAIELLYLCLNGDLCQTRSAVDGDFLGFFTKVYDRPSLAEFLGRLTSLDGRVLNDLPREAMGLYQKLIAAFKKLLVQEAAWGPRKRKLPVWKILYANYSRFHLAGRILAENKEVRQSAGILEDQARAVIRILLAH